jgi:TolA-binding protein
VTLANTYGSQNNAAKMAETMLEAAAKIPHHPYIADVLIQTAQLFYDAQGYEQAAVLYGKFLSLNAADPRSEEALYFRALCLVKAGRTDDGITALRDFIAKYPASTRKPEAQFEVAETYFNARRFEQAIREYERTAHDYAKTPFALSSLFNKGWCYLQMKDTASMVGAFETLVALHPESQEAADAQFSIGDYYYNKQNYDKAREAYTVIVTKFPDNVRAVTAASLIKELEQISSFKEYEMAMRPFDAKDYKKAIDALTALMKKYPDADVRYACEVNIASAYEELGQKKKSLDLFTDILTRYKDVPAAQNVIFFAEQHKRWIESGKTE